MVAPESSTEIPNDPTLRVLDLLVNGVLNGTDLSPVRDDVTRILSNQEDKARIITTLIQNHDFHRINLMLQVRAEQEQRLWKASRRGDLTTSESLAFFRLASGEIGKITDLLRSDKGPSAMDSATAVDKVDPNRREGDRQLQETYHSTTPHGREIIRKRLYDMKRATSKEAS